MYTIIGGDGREYGPVTADQVRTWVAGGRANKDTKVKLAGAAEWKTVADFPELSGGGSPADLTQPPMSLSSAPASADLGIVNFDVISCYERSWTLLKANFWPFIGVTFLVFAIGAAAGQVGVKTSLLFQVLVGVPLNAGLYYYFLLKLRGQPATVVDVFSGFKRAYIPLVLAYLVAVILVLVGAVFLILPGIYLLVAYSMVTLLLVDKQVGFWEGLETSRKTVTRHWWSVFGLLLLGIPFMLLGLVCLLVGIFVALPLIAGALAYAYEDLFNGRR